MTNWNWSEEQLAEHYAKLKQPQPDGAVVTDQPESLIQAECVKLMEEDGWRALRTDPVSDKGRGKGFGELGMADYLFMRPREIWGDGEYACDVLWVEFKARGGTPKKHQTEWHTKEQAKGFCTWIASVDFPASVAGFRDHYYASGLMRRARWW